MYVDKALEQIACMMDKENERQINAVADFEGIEILKIMIDSGASNNVMPEEACTDVDMYETRETGRKYVCANGSEIKNLGGHSSRMKVRRRR